MKFNEYKDGRRYLRNTQDRAKELSYALRDQLKEHWKQQRSILSSPIPEPTNINEETTQNEEDILSGISRACK